MTTKSQKPLPKLKDLHQDPAAAFKNDELKTLLNQPPHETWIKRHPIVKVKNDKGESVASQYLPIDKVEFNLDYIFGVWNIEIKNTFALFNSVCSIVRVNYKDPVTGDMRFHDGVGAAVVQTEAGASAADLSKIKSAAVQMAAPSSVSYAIKDACEHLGKLFGRDLNRRDTIAFIGAFDEPVTAQQPVLMQSVPAGGVAQPMPPQPYWNGTAWVLPQASTTPAGGVQTNPIQSAQKLPF